MAESKTSKKALLTTPKKILIIKQEFLSKATYDQL